MQTWTAQLLMKEELNLGEGAHWHDRWRQFIYIDIEGKKIGRIDAKTRNSEEIILHKRIGTAVPFENDQLIVALESSIELLDFETKKLSELTKLELNKPGNRSNDGKCDAAGRLWVGTMNMDAKMHEGALYAYDGELKTVLKNVSVSNGICWTKDNTTMYYIDSLAYDIKAYDFDLANGNISNKRVVTKIPATGQLLDGMSIDLEGKLWVAVWGGGCVQRYDPIHGELIGKVFVDAPNVTSCAFGGDRMQQLLITTARAGLDPDQLEQYPLSGSLFIADTGIEGATMHPFKNQAGRIHII